MSRRPNATVHDSEASPASEPVAIRLTRVVVRAHADVADRTPVSFILPSGGSHVITGERESGKTALLAMVGLARPPSQGGLELFGQDVASVPPARRHTLRRRIGMIFQDLRLDPELTAWDNVALAARAVGRKPGTYDGPLRETLGWVGLARRADTLAGALDDEGLRRLAVARAVINRPDLVIADEPAGADGEAILRLLADLNAAGTAILMATRDGVLAANAGTDVTVIGRTSSAAESVA